MEAVTFDVLIKSYMEIGLMALMAILLILGSVVLFKKFLKDNSDKDKHVDDANEKILTLSEAFIKTIKEQNEYLIKQVVEQVTQHTPSVKENKQLTNVVLKIEDQLEVIKNETGASRVCLVQYHNGGRGINKQSFLKMSVTNERMKVGETALAPMFKDQFRSVLSYVTSTLENQNTCYIQNLQDIKNIDYGTYDFLQTRDIKQIYIMAVHGEQNMVIGFIMVSFNTHNEVNGDEKIVDDILNAKAGAIEALLSIDTQS